MNRNIKLCALFISVLISTYGCGGGGSGTSFNTDLEILDSSAPDSQSNPSSPNKGSQKPSNQTANSITINPLIELGLQRGESVCFRLKSYNNTTSSEFSEPACSRIRNEQALILSWENPSNEVVGYYVYFSQNGNKNNFLADVIAI